MTMTAEYMNRLNELTTNEEFCAKLGTATTRESIHALFAAEGVELDDNMMDVIMQKVETALSGELDEDMLEAVSGGCKGCVGIGLIAGLCAASWATPVGAVAIGIGVWVACSIYAHGRKKRN